MRGRHSERKEWAWLELCRRLEELYPGDSRENQGPASNGLLFVDHTCKTAAQARQQWPLHQLRSGSSSQNGTELLLASSLLAATTEQLRRRIREVGRRRPILAVAGDWATRRRRRWIGVKVGSERQWRHASGPDRFWGWASPWVAGRGRRRRQRWYIHYMFQFLIFKNNNNNYNNKMINNNNK